MSKEKRELFDLEAALDSVDLSFPGYVPSVEAFDFFNIIRLVNGEDFEFDTPMWHYFAVDAMLGKLTDVSVFPYSEEVKKQIELNPNRIGILSARGIGKSSVVSAFFPVYCAVKGVVPGMGRVPFVLALGASTQGGGRVMAKAIQSMCEDSSFCLSYFESMRFTETEAEFVRKGTEKKDKRTFLLRTMGANTGSIRGVRSNVGAHRPSLIIFDDCVPNMAAAYSEVQMKNLEDSMNSDAINALKGGGNGKIFNVFTPFHMNDPNVKNILNKSYTPIVVPICEKIGEDMKKGEFVGAWEEMHPFEAVKQQYLDAKKSGTVASFNQERMLRVASEDDRLIQDDMIQWYDRNLIMRLLGGYSLYMVTDFTTTGGALNDFSALAVFAVSSNMDWFLLDLCLRKQELQEQYDEVFRMFGTWSMGGRYIEVGVEIDGQQKAHVFALKEMMQKRNQYFSFARQKGAAVGQEGVRSGSVSGRKIDRFRYVVPQFQNKKIWLPEQLKETADMKELVRQLRGATTSGFTWSDDGPDLFTMMSLIDLRPGNGVDEESLEYSDKDRGIWSNYFDEEKEMSKKSTIF